MTLQFRILHSYGRQDNPCLKTTSQFRQSIQLIRQLIVCLKNKF